MKCHIFGQTGLSSSRLIYGCMRVVGDGSRGARKKGEAAIHHALERGYTHFDHADIYAGGESEALFGKCLRTFLSSEYCREQFIITSKCGIRNESESTSQVLGRSVTVGSASKVKIPKRYDFSKAHILSSVENSLHRLQTDYLDILLLHRPDFLMDVHEVAEAFNELKDQGKVCFFGVSNFSVSQVELLQSALSFPLVANQLEINLHNAQSFSDGSLDQCQLQNIVPMAWCPLANVVYEAWGNTFSSDRLAMMNAELARQASIYDCSPQSIVFAWLIKHPSKIFPIVGSTSLKHIDMAISSFDFIYSREDWYSLWEARSGSPVA